MITEKHGPSFAPSNQGARQRSTPPRKRTTTKTKSVKAARATEKEARDKPLSQNGLSQNAIPIIDMRSLSVDASSSSQFCAASRVPSKLCCSSPHMCSTPAWQSSGGSSTSALLRAGEQRHALRTSTSATPFPARLPVATSDSATFNASSGGDDAYNSGLACSLVFLRDPLSRARWASLVVPCQSPPILS